MTIAELMIVAVICVVLFAGFFRLGWQQGQSEKRAVQSQLSDARETILYLSSMAAKGLKRNRGKDESVESFVREYIVRLEGAEAIYRQAMTIQSKAFATAGIVEGEHHA